MRDPVLASHRAASVLDPGASSNYLFQMRVDNDRYTVEPYPPANFKTRFGEGVF